VNSILPISSYLRLPTAMLDHVQEKDNRIIEENVNYQRSNFILPFNNKSHKIKVY
jgi:hypothetical protein